MILISNTRCPWGLHERSRQDLYNSYDPFTTLYDLTDVTFRCRVCGGGGLHYLQAEQNDGTSNDLPNDLILSIVSSFSAFFLIFGLVLTILVFSLSGRVITL